MSTYNIQQVSKSTKTKMGAIGLAVLPVAAAMYSVGSFSPEQVPGILTSGIFPIGFTILSWAIAAKLTMRLRK